MEADKREAWGSPSEGDGWMTGEIRRLLAAIRGEHAWKKRTTVVKLAFARAQGLPVAGVFEQEDVVSERCWYQKWKHLPAVARAFEACFERALAWRDEETAQAEAKYADERRRLIAEQSLSAVKGLALTALNVSDRADYRTEASRVLLALADEELATRLGTGGRAALAVEIDTPVEVDAPRLDKLLMEVLYGSDGECAVEECAGLGGGEQASGVASVPGDGAN